MALSTSAHVPKGGWEGNRAATMDPCLSPLSVFVPQCSTPRFPARQLCEVRLAVVTSLAHVSGSIQKCIAGFCHSMTQAAGVTPYRAVTDGMGGKERTSDGGTPHRSLLPQWPELKLHTHSRAPQGAGQWPAGCPGGKWKVWGSTLSVPVTQEPTSCVLPRAQSSGCTVLSCPSVSRGFLGTSPPPVPIHW